MLPLDFEQLETLMLNVSALMAGKREDGPGEDYFYSIIIFIIQERCFYLMPFLCNSSIH